MSFILDAIAKSEHDRQQHEVPTASTLALPIDSVQRPRRSLSYLVLVALLLNVIIVVVWMQSDWSLLNWFSPSRTVAIEQSAEQALESGESSATNQIGSVDNAPTATSEKSIVEIDNTASKQTGAITSSSKLIEQTDKTESTSELLIEPKGKTLTERHDTNADQGGESALTSTQPEVETTSAADTARVGIESDTWSDEIQPDELANQSPDMPDTGEVMHREVSRLSDLPADVRRDLPGVNFSGHLYSTNPESSYVFVNDGRSVTEGQQIVDELTLYKVTPTGVIVEFRGYLIDVGVLQSWNLK